MSWGLSASPEVDEVEDEEEPRVEIGGEMSPPRVAKLKAADEEGEW